MKLNQKLIEQLRNGEIAAENNGTVEQLEKVLKAAFPRDTPPRGRFIYYFLNTDYTDEWDCHNKTNLPIKPISDFFQPELFTGWAKDDNYPGWMFYFKKDIPTFGFDSLGVWQESDSNFNYSKDEGNRPATNEEIEATLIKESKRRGYEAGITCFFREGMYRRFLEGGEIKYIPNWANGYGALSLGYDVIFREDTGQWAEIIEQPKAKTKTNPIKYLVDGTTYSLNYQELKAEYDNVVAYSDEGFMANLPQIAHLSCIVSYFKGLGNNATIGDKGIIHELIHLMTEPNEPTNDLQEIREKFNKLIKLV